MSVYEHLSQNNRVAMAFATALEQALGPDVILTVGLPLAAAPDASTLPADARVALIDVITGATGRIAIVVTDDIGRQLEASAPDEELLTALTEAFDAAVGEAVAAGSLSFGRVRACSVADFVASFPDDHQYLVHPLLDGTERIATLVIQVGAEAQNASAPNASAQNIDVDRDREPVTQPAMATVAADPLPSMNAHQFDTLPDANAISLIDPRPLSLLHDVEMGVTAELGRRRMSVRDLLSLTPGAVIELDRAAGSPVDVLVNGTLIARGEVVVIDEEFGIRISEIVAGVEAGVR